MTEGVSPPGLFCLHLCSFVCSVDGFLLFSLVCLRFAFEHSVIFVLIVVLCLLMFSVVISVFKKLYIDNMCAVVFSCVHCVQLITVFSLGCLLQGLG